MRSLILGNGSLLVSLNNSGEVSDLYYPHPGLENHTGGLVHRIGVYCNNTMSWLSEDARWDIRVECEDDSLESRIIATHRALGIELLFKDIVYNESPIFLRNVTVKNLAAYEREIKIYFAHEFRISRTPGGDTAFFDPTSNALIHYKGKRAFLINGEYNGMNFSEYAIGHSRFDGMTGTFRDAEDGMLSNNPIEHGNVDSVIGFYQTYDANATKMIRYWLTAGDSIEQALELNAYVLKKSPQHLVQTAGNFWRAWINRYQFNFYELSPEAISLFKKSLMFVRAHVDDDGGIIASADEEVLKYEEDTYAYVWMRDASYGALALDRAGDPSVAERFFSFCHGVISADGYFMHKYRPDRALGSSWHPWVHDDGTPQLPIQEDETALVVWALAEHYKHSRDLEFIEKLYNSLIEKAANFLASYRDPTTGLPHSSYDLWEERRGVSTFSASAVYGALMAAADIADVLGKKDRKRFYQSAASEVKKGIATYLMTPESGFAKMLVHTPDGRFAPDETADISSAYGPFAFGVLEPDDPILVEAFEKIVKRLSVRGGVARYEHDTYYAEGSNPNPWFIATLWYAEFLIARAKTEKDFAAVRDIFEWTVKHALNSGMLAEQVSATNGKPCSVAPLMWSHAAYVNAVLKYLDRLQELGICEDCNPVP